MNANVNLPESPGEIFLGSFRLLKKTCIHLMPLTIFLSIVIVSPSLFIYNPHNPWLFFGYFIFSIFVFSSAIYYIWHINRGEKIDLKKAVLVTVKKLPALLVATILISIVTLSAYVFLIIPGVIVTVWLSMALPLMLIQSIGPLAVFRKSYELTTDEWSRTAIVIFLPVMLTSLIDFGITTWFVFYEMTFVYYKLAVVLFVLFTSLFYLPWVASLVILQFEDLKKRKAIRLLHSQPVPKNQTSGL